MQHNVGQLVSLPKCEQKRGVNTNVGVDENWVFFLGRGGASQNLGWQSALQRPLTDSIGGRTVRCARAVRALCEKLAVLHHREFGKFRRLKGRH